MSRILLSQVENIIMAGNEIENLTADVLTKMKYVKKVDFRMNKLTLPSGWLGNLLAYLERFE